MIHRYYIFDSELVMHPDGKNGLFGTVEVNGVAYHVTIKRDGMQINGQTVTRYSSAYGLDVTRCIAADQQMSAWYLAQHGKEFFRTVKDTAKKYHAGTVIFYVHRAEDGTCWRYYTSNDCCAINYEHYSPWYSAIIPPNLAHFKQWIWESIYMESDGEDE